MSAHQDGCLPGNINLRPSICSETFVPVIHDLLNT